MMKSQIFTALLLVALAVGAPVSEEDDEKVTVTKNFFPDFLIKYTSKHDIVKIIVPINSLNFDENSSESESNSKETDSEVTIFFVEADVDENGKRDYKGLYVLKEGKSKMILANGVDAAASCDDSKKVYLAATDGLYTYKDDDKTAVKYGSLTDNIKGIAKEKSGDVLYILTDDNNVYNVTNNGNSKVKVDGIENAQQIVLDYSDNLYYYTPDKKIHVKTADGITEITGLPANPTKVNIIRPPFIIEDGLPILIDNVAYIAYSNGTSENSDFDFEADAIPTAFGMEPALIQYYAYNKNIYEYNILAMVLGEILDELKTFLSGKTDSIQSIATRKKNKV
ncbi:uncharacterized protein LOC126972831 isoform X2 [Leptidea sinapis]|uniref:Uncharacterized protein n=2 Tax=Leptidea sinapis TaxID=189913 RepID=A0A5E4QDB1_9NEOP|nr:uncharacterized protein LOC126972831 isoform X2 [Leptidea sinapis]VVC96219.1 unnamed protein product [Leptidea sinapis]